MLLRRKCTGRAIVLMYHRVMPESERVRCFSHPSIVLGAEVFEMQMAFLAERLRPISAGVLQEHLDCGRRFEPGSVLVTFDDGWQDNYLHAMPILRKYNIPALIFLSTGFVGRRQGFWQERLTRLCEEALPRATSAPPIAKALDEALGKDVQRRLIETQGAMRRAILMAAIQSLKSASYTQIETLIARFETLVGNGAAAQGDGDREFLSWQEIREMKEAGIDFGSHGVNHLILDKPGVDVDFELRQSKVEIEKQLGRAVSAFSYPNGNFNPLVAEGVKSCGYSIAFGTRFGYNGPAVNRFSLKRINIPQEGGETIALFLGRLLGFW